MWGIYLNGIGCWGRGNMLPCEVFQIMLRTEGDDCITVQDTVVDPITGEVTMSTRTVPFSDALATCETAYTTPVGTHY